MKRIENVLLGALILLYIMLAIGNFLGYYKPSDFFITFVLAYVAFLNFQFLRLK